MYGMNCFNDLAWRYVPPSHERAGRSRVQGIEQPVWYGMVWGGAVWFDMVRYDWYGMVWYVMVWYDMLLYGVVKP